jgi:ATP-dependent exoDNAse (exonuclease V) beta subunit
MHCHYSSVEQMTPHDKIEIEALDDLSEVSQEKSLVEMTTLLEQRSSRLKNAEDENGIELATIHGAKGREWDTVIFFGADADQLPHSRALVDADNDAEFEEAIEDERRLAYVAITRTKERLVVVSTGNPSPFLREAGISSSGAQLPTLESTRLQRDEPFQREDRVEDHPSGKPKPRPSTRARYSGFCGACKRDIAKGSSITRVDERWIHESCAS